MYPIIWQLFSSDHIIELTHNTYFLQCNISPGLRPNPHTPLYSSTNNGPLSSHPWRFMDCTTYLQEGSYSITRRRYVRLPSDVYNLTWHLIFSLRLTGQHNPTSCTRGMSQYGIIVRERTSTPVCTCVPKLCSICHLQCEICVKIILQATDTVEPWQWGCRVPISILRCT